MSVNANKRHLVGQDGKPFFYLADTAWRFLYCTDKGMAERYMRTRAEQGFTVENAYVYGKFLGERYKDRPNLIWVLGGDRNPAEDGAKVADEKYVAIWRSMAKGIRAGDGHRHLMTYHPAPRDYLDSFSSADWMPDETWIDFNMLQTGTKIDRPNYRYIRRDYEHMREEGPDADYVLIAEVVGPAES